MLQLDAICVLHVLKRNKVFRVCFLSWLELMHHVIVAYGLFPFPLAEEEKDSINESFLLSQDNGSD